jgi:hypothetical protein
MVEFRYLHGAVYIFENSEAQRVKVGMTIISTTNVEDRLRDINNMWLEKKVTNHFSGPAVWPVILKVTVTQAI